MLGTARPVRRSLFFIWEPQRLNGGLISRSPDGARVVGIIVARAILDLAVQALDAAAHGMRVVDVDVVVLPADRLLHKRFHYPITCKASQE